MKSNRYLRRAMKQPHWQSNSQYCAWNGREWIVIKTKSWAASADYLMWEFSMKCGEN